MASHSIVRVDAALDAPIALNLLGDRDGSRRYVLLCDVLFAFGAWVIQVPKGYEFDGPSIPRLLWCLAGFSPADIETSLASCLHDFICEHPGLVPRIIGDGIFFLLLGPVVFNGRRLPGVGARRREAMYVAVRAYSRLSGKDWT